MGARCVICGSFWPWYVIVTGAAVLAPTNASADAGSDRYEQYRYAVETINLTYSQYVARQTDFRANGCVNGTSGCRKPAPYNAFDWTDDGCSGRSVIGPISNVYRNLFNQPCRLHDFGYRNFGKGLTLYKNESMRAIIDNRLKAEMIRLCNHNFSHVWQVANKAACLKEANAVYGAVRILSDWGSYRHAAATSGQLPRRRLQWFNDRRNVRHSASSSGQPPRRRLQRNLYDGTCGTPPPPAQTIQFSQGAAAAAGYWYNVYLSGFAPGSQVTLPAGTPLIPVGSYDQLFTIDGAGHAGDSTLCFSGDHPDHWVTSSNGVQSNHLTW